MHLLSEFLLLALGNGRILGIRGPVQRFRNSLHDETFPSLPVQPVPTVVGRPIVVAVVRGIVPVVVISVSTTSRDFVVGGFIVIILIEVWVDVHVDVHVVVIDLVIVVHVITVVIDSEYVVG